MHQAWGRPDGSGPEQAPRSLWGDLVGELSVAGRHDPRPGVADAAAQALSETAERCAHPRTVCSASTLICLILVLRLSTG